MNRQPDIYHVPETFADDSAPENDDELSFELATAWQRLGAYFLNQLLSVLSFVPGAFLGAMLVGGDSGQRYAYAVLGALAGYLILCIFQLIWMTRDGQSLGKKIMKIRVIDEDGGNPGFVRYVLQREFLVYLLLGVVVFIVAFVSEALSNFINLAFWMICLVMLFRESDNRQTLQDKFAKTYVVQVE